jgi:hypothetical protein
VVVVDREHPAELLDRLLGRPAQDDRAVPQLCRERLLATDRGAEHAVAPHAGRVGRTAGGEGERVGAGRTDPGRDRQRSRGV